MNTKPLSPKGSPFYRLQAEQVNWTNFDPNLVEEVVKRGIDLEEENNRLKNFPPKEARKAFWTHWGDFGAVMSIAAVIGVCTILVALIVWACNNSNSYNDGFKNGSEQQVAAAVAYVEARYRHVDPSQIKLEFPHGYIFDFKGYVHSLGFGDPSGYTKDNIEKWTKDYRDFQDNYTPPYTIFITPKANLLDDRTK
jgi:hypothetical protein